MPAGIGIKKTISNRFIFEEIRLSNPFSLNNLPVPPTRWAKLEN